MAWQAVDRPPNATFSCSSAGFLVTLTASGGEDCAIVALTSANAFPSAYTVSVNVSITVPSAYWAAGGLAFAADGQHLSIYADNDYGPDSYAPLLDLEAEGQQIYVNSGQLFSQYEWQGPNQHGDVQKPSGELKAQVNGGNITLSVDGKQVESYGGVSQTPNNAIALVACYYIALTPPTDQTQILFSNFSYTPQ